MADEKPAFPSKDLVARWALENKLSNGQDRKVVTELSTAPLGSLDVDRCAQSLNLEVRRLREALKAVYAQAAAARHRTAVTIPQLDQARKSLEKLRSGLTLLREIVPEGYEGFNVLVGMAPFSSLKDDIPAEAAAAPPAAANSDAGWTEFSAKCRKIDHDLTSSVLEFERAIDAEERKERHGRRRKRLRSLVEALFDWWKETTGKMPTIVVDANRRDDGPAVVHGRFSPFLDLAKALLVRLDGFDESAVVSAITNVDECRRTP